MKEGYYLKGECELLVEVQDDGMMFQHADGPYMGMASEFDESEFTPLVALTDDKAVEFLRSRGYAIIPREAVEK